MKITAKVLAVKDDLAKVKIISQQNPLKENDKITIRRGSHRNTSQNALYWVYLDWLVKEGGMKEQGFFNAESLHESLKAYFLSEKKYDKGAFKVLTTESTTDLSKGEFATYFNDVDGFIVEFFGVDTTPFWEVHRKFYGGM